MKISVFLHCCLVLWAFPAWSQHVPYGNNPQAGHYFNTGEVRLYYEIYGKGAPLVLLHGGVFGYIDEFEHLIPKLAERYQVICIATRGHGKSEIGHMPFTYDQRADDAYRLVRSITQDSVTVLGFSDGGYSGLKLAALHPELVRKLIAIGVGDQPRDSVREKYHYTAEQLKKAMPAFAESRLKLMPEPQRWDECLLMLSYLYNRSVLSRETFEKIQCPVLVMNGDNDAYHSVASALDCVKWIPRHQLSVIPGCHHVVLYCNFPAVWEAIKPFL
jgi:pimeloyl-ACP methyl ester carboxylesterase